MVYIDRRRVRINDDSRLPVLLDRMVKMDFSPGPQALIGFSTITITRKLDSCNAPKGVSRVVFKIERAGYTGSF